MDADRSEPPAREPGREICQGIVGGAARGVGIQLVVRPVRRVSAIEVVAGIGFGTGLEIVLGIGVRGLRAARIAEFALEIRTETWRGGRGGGSGGGLIRQARLLQRRGRGFRLRMKAGERRRRPPLRSAPFGCCPAGGEVGSGSPVLPPQGQHSQDLTSPLRPVRGRSVSARRGF